MPAISTATLFRIALATILIAVLAGCTHTVIQANASPCSALLPSSWLNGASPAALPKSAKLPDGHDDARPWQSGFIEQTGQLEMANSRDIDAVGIVSRCEARDAIAIRRARPNEFRIL